jgi:hypothetical protein
MSGSFARGPSWRTVRYAMTSVTSAPALAKLRRDDLAADVGARQQHVHGGDGRWAISVDTTASARNSDGTRSTLIP